MAIASAQSHAKSSAQSKIATGSANSTPLAKLPRTSRVRESADESTGTEPSLSTTSLFIIAIDLLLFCSKLYKRITLSGGSGCAQKQIRKTTRVDGAATVQPVPAAALRRAPGLLHELQDLALVLRLVAASMGESRQTAGQSVLVGLKRPRPHHRTFVLRVAVFVCLCICSPRLAFAQNEEVVTPIELFDPASGEGLRISPGFVLYPQATAEVRYDSNIYNVDGAEVSDTYFALQPFVAIRSDFSRHSVSLEGRAEIRRYFETSEENSEQFDLVGKTLLDLAYGIDVEAFVGFARRIEQRGTAGDIFFTDEPVEYNEVRGGFEVSRRGGTLELEAGANLVEKNYSDTIAGGVPVDLSDRDNTIRSARLRADYRVSERTNVFGEISGNEIDFDLASIPQRNSSGYAVLAGITYEVTSLVEIEAGVGYIHQGFDDPTVENASDFNFRLAAIWTPKPNLRVTAAALRFVDASRTLDAPAIVVSQIQAGAQRAVGDRALVGIEAGYVEESYRGVDRNDRRFFLAGSSTIRMTDRIGLVARAGYRTQDGGASGRSYDGFTVSLGVTAAW